MRRLGLLLEKKKTSLCPEMQLLCRLKRAPIFFFPPKRASLRYIIWAFEINVTPTFWVFRRGAECFLKMAPKKKRKKKKKKERKEVLSLYKDLHEAGLLKVVFSSAL